jgi:hypothetical protein
MLYLSRRVPRLSETLENPAAFNRTMRCHLGAAIQGTPTRLLVPGVRGARSASALRNPGRGAARGLPRRKYPPGTRPPPGLEQELLVTFPSTSTPGMAARGFASARPRQ